MHKIQQYKVIGEPMRGGMGQVVHLYHNYWHKDVAMKQPLEKYFQSETGRRRFFEECDRWMSLGIHPNIVQCYLVNDVDGIPSVFMEWMEQGSLSAQVRSGKLYEGTGEQALSRVLDAALQMAQGLSYSHKKGILHLDVKPDNVLVDQDGCYKISDFGLASLLNQESNRIAYTPGYCAPEQQTGIGIDSRTDIYCWGVSLLHMLIGEIIWLDGVAAGVAVDSILQRAVVPVPENLKNLLKGCLQYEMQKRPGNFGEVIRELGTIYSEVSGSAYVDQLSDYDGTSLDAFNNMAISYYYLGDTERAFEQWRWNYLHNPNHQASMYNYLVYRFRYQGSCKPDVLKFQEKRTDFYARFESMAPTWRLQSQWRYSLGAYGWAYQCARKAVEADKNVLGGSPTAETVENFRYMKEAYMQYGPAIIKNYDMKASLKLEGETSEDTILISYIYDDRIIYVRRMGEVCVFDLTVPKMKRYSLGLKQVACAVLSRNGRYLAVGTADETVCGKYQIRVMDLETMKIMFVTGGANLSHGLKYMTFVEQEQIYPVLLASDEWSVVAFRINGEIVDNRYQSLMKPDQPVTGLLETRSGCLIAKTENDITVYDVFSLAPWSTTHSTYFSKLEGYQMTEIPNTNFVILLDSDGGFAVYDYAAQRVVTKECFLMDGTERVYQLSVDRSGKKLAVLCGNNLEIRQMVDYENLKEPIWKVSPIQSTAELMEKANRIADTYKVLEQALDVVINKSPHWEVISYKALLLKLGNVRDYYYTSHRTLDKYDKIAVKMALAFGFYKVWTEETPWTRTDESIEYLSPQEDGSFLDKNGRKKLGIQIHGDNVHLVSFEKGNVLKENICRKEELLGLSDDYCRLICKNKIIRLEWLFDVELKV